LPPLVIRKLGAPFDPELAVGAVASGNVTVYNDALLGELGLRRADVAAVRERELAELERRERAYGATQPPDVAGRAVIVVDDGMATLSRGGGPAHAASVARHAASFECRFIELSRLRLALHDASSAGISSRL
jgi:putative phosphoribosyl transferase